MTDPALSFRRARSTDVPENVTLLRYRGSVRTALTFLDGVRLQLDIVRYGDRVRDGAEQVFRRYGRKHRLSLCDAISFVVVTTLLGRGPEARRF